MRRPVRSVLGAVLISGLAASVVAARAECDPARQTEPVASRFETHGDTVYDKKTGLSWMRCSYGQRWSDADGCSGTAALLDWDTAMGLHPEGAAWRLPERDELQSIVDHSCKRPAINDTVFPATPSIQYWTSTASSPSYAWIVYFRTGMPTWNFPKSTPFAARLVHEGR